MGSTTPTSAVEARRTGPLTGALIASTLVGLLVAGLALPVVAGVGLVVKNQADAFLELPGAIELPDVAQRSRILAADGSLVAVLYAQNRAPVRLDDVPEIAKQAVLAIEDSRFYEHNGVDVKGTLRAAVENATEGRVEQGGSTLTQQYVKNALVLAATSEEQQRSAREVSLDRKLREARYALAIEGRLSKDEIFERYLNIAYFGNGVYGIGTAAGHYFGKPVQELTASESALLAGLLRNPGGYDPVRAPAVAVARRNVVLTRMAARGHLSEQQRAEAAGEPLELHLSPVGSGCEAPEVTAPFFCDYVRRVLEDSGVGALLGRTREERQQRLLAGGLTIRTTLDPVAQQAGQAAVDGGIPRDDPSGVAAAFTAVEPGTGAVKAIAVNRSFGEDDAPGQTKLNLALGGSSGMQAGSTFKPFVLAAAVEKNIPLGLTLYAPRRYTSRTFTTCENNRCGLPYTVGNAGDSQAGTYNVVTGTQSSVNTFYLQLQERTGVERPAEIAEALGLQQFESGRPTGPMLRGGSFTLGVNEVSPLAMSAAYAAFAAHGSYCPPRPVVEVLDAEGQVLPLPPQQCTQALPPEVADTVTSVLRGVIEGPLRGRTGRGAAIDRPAAGKTGSTNGSKAAWFVGYTPQLAGAVWVGTPVPTEMQRVTVAGTYYRQVYGGTVPAPMWAQAMSGALAGTPVADLPPLISRPSSTVRGGGGGSSTRPPTRRPAPRSTRPPTRRAPAPAPAAPAPAPPPPAEQPAEPAPAPAEPAPEAPDAG
jgi:membrane peptidoglycan carboxypeptidase